MRYTIALIAAISLTACTKEEIQTSKLVVPETYTFERNGTSTVDLSGQLIRQEMLTELVSEIKSGTDTLIASTTLIDMYDNANNPFSDATLNTSGKSISSKTSASATHVFDQGSTINMFKAYLQDAASASGNTASVGVAGVLASNDGSKKYLIAPNGLEYAQIVQKGLMGAFLMDQMVNHYLTPLKLDVDNDASQGTSPTDMEHHWDEAYGYFTLVTDYSTDATVVQDRGPWGKYLLELEESFHLASDTYLAFRTGRQAIVNKEYAIRDAQVEIIAENLEKATYIKALSYLNKGAAKLNSGDAALAFHSLSEGAGFIYSLRFIASEKVSDAQSTAWLNTLLDGDGFWAGDILTRIEAVKTDMGATLGLSSDIVNGTY